MTELINTFAPSHQPPRSVYIHVPFCRHRCGYCNFSVVAGRDHLVDRYLGAIETEIGELTERFEIDTLFLGGGTPSHLSPAVLRRLMESVHSRFDFKETIEFSAECNPNDLDDETAKALAESGVNRISLGVQSLNPRKLYALERDHTIDDVRTAIRNAREFASSVSLDMIFAAPNETLPQWRDDLEAALQLGPDHISTYELTFEKGTRFWNRLAKKELAEADEDLRAEMYVHAIDRLETAGLPQYEVSSFGAAQHRCRHNEVYWSGEPYFAFGPGASRFVDGVRETNHQSTLQYLKLIESGQSPVAQTEKLDPESAARERLAIGLRHVDGVEESAFQKSTGFSIENLLGRHVETLLHNKLISRDDEHLRLTKSGRMIYDHLATLIVRE